MFIKETKIEKNRADQNPATLKPGTMYAAKIIIAAFITRENSPKVKILIGNVNRKINGLINIFIKVKTTTATTAPRILTLTPGNKYAAKIIINADKNKCLKFIFVLN